MNVFDLFGTQDIESVKLGIQVVKTLGYEKEFKRCFKVSINNFEKVFSGFVKHTYNKPFNYFMSISYRAFLSNYGESRNKSLNSRFDSIKIGCVLLENNFTSFYFNSSGISVDLKYHYKLFCDLEDKITYTDEIIEIINNYFNERI